MLKNNIYIYDVLNYFKKYRKNTYIFIFIMLDNKTDVEVKNISFKLYICV